MPEPLLINPFDFQLFSGLPVPDPITFTLGQQWLGQEMLYPRQATLLKITFLRDDLFTEYDHKVIDEWEFNFTNRPDGLCVGITPGVRERIKFLKDSGYKWFREVLLVMGRRAGKGYVSGISMAYVLWNYMALGNPQKHYGISQDKTLECLIYAGKKEQARKNLWKDLNDAVLGGDCFAPYISRAQGESLTVFAPYDKIRMLERQRKGVHSYADQASFRIEPKEATLMSGRGGASYCIGFDEMAHVVATGANRSAEEIYSTATPSLDQFKKDAFIIEPSSPYQMTGQFYTNYENALATDPETGNPIYPNKLVLQLASWEIYKDWEIAHTIDAFPREFEGDLGEYLDKPPLRFPRLFSAPQELNEEMLLEQQSNPDTFKVERLAQWATTMDAYLNAEKIGEMWSPILENKVKAGKMSFYYKGHGDPSNTNANFGLAVAHLEDDPEGSGFKVCVFDYITHWDPANFPDHTLDYVYLMDELWHIIKTFPLDEFTIDQFNSGPIISFLKNQMIKNQHLLGWKRPQISEVTANAALNWKKAENFKIALNQGWIKAPFYELADLELKFLQLTQTKTTMRVDKQDTGPCTTKDVADAMFECVYALLGDQIAAFKEGLTTNPIMGTLQGGITPFGQLNSRDEQVFSMFSQFTGGAGRWDGGSGFGGSINPTRGIRRDDNRPRRGY